MLSEKEFIDKVWIDYEKYVSGKEKKDKFYDRHVYKNTESLVLLKSVAMFIVAFTITATLIGGVYAGIKTYTENKKIEQQEAKAEDGSYAYYQKNHDMDDYEKNIPWWKRTVYSYHKIKTYEEYLEAKEVISGLIEMTEEDFKDNFMIIIGTFQAMNLSDQGVYIKDVSADDTTLTILLDIDENKENLDVSVKLPLDMEREYIDLLLDNQKPEMTGYKPIDDIIADYKSYTKDQAKADNCVVKDLSYGNLEEFDKFLEETKQGKNSCIRVVSYGNKGVGTITDVEYKDGEYIIEEASIEEVHVEEINDGEIAKRYYTGDTFEVNIRENNDVGFRKINYILRNKKRETVLLERYNKKVKEDYEK